MSRPPRELVVPAADDYPLAATLHPAGDDVRRPSLVVIGSATGVKRGYYSRFADFLAGWGFDVLSFDYRGIGGSRQGALAGFQACMREWGELDLEAALAWAAAERPASRLLVVGHSAGGQLLGLAPGRSRVRALLGVAAQSGDFRCWPQPSRILLAGLWYAGMPLAARAIGYFPRWLGSGEDLPRGVALEWSHWCRTPGYLVAAGGEARRQAFASFSAPILAFSFSDDVYAPRAAVDALLGFYTGARRTHRHVVPAQVGARRIGHFGFFRERFRETLWQEAAAWLRSTADG